ncbi:glycoside hydrolase family 95 protein [Cohnella terricola]|uniref:Glycoside hydrolase family 95 protein n=1 Tax=Cohnella terricola TaxID=1289167 RepID=A0A559JQM0_9BACL|nr:glycoside hydrolase family 95 protein [Cohnella terricola]TVY02174.1 glycoside hydrolase family 95 protein [Cohnella terricola]
MKLFYDSPAKGWTQGLPIGNGSLGAMVQSDTKSEIWTITESTYWSGNRERTPSRSDGKRILDQIRERFFEGDYQEGERLVSELLQPNKGNFGTNMQMCDVRIVFDHLGEQINRELDLENAVVRVTYFANGCHYERETFASHPDGVIVSRIRVKDSRRLSFELDVAASTEAFVVTASDSGDSLNFTSKAIETIHSNGECGVEMSGLARIEVRGGTIRAEMGKLIVRDADEAYIILSVSTDYGRGGNEWKDEPAQRVAKAAALGFESLREAHIEDYRRLFARVALDLGASADDRENLPLDRRLAMMRDEGGAAYLKDTQLFALFYQFGRYLTIAGSREDSRLPMHLQGIWNDGEANRMAWSCDYHLDVNTEMNYYLTETSNLAESHEPLLTFLERLAEDGRTAAKDFYGCDGWVAHVFTNAWGFTAPGWHYSWGLNVTGGLWLAMQLIDRYEFGCEDAYLRYRAYPVLRAAAVFYLDYMTLHPKNGYLVTGPSNSPENSFIPVNEPNMSRTMSMGPTMDTMLVRRLFIFSIEASEKLGVDTELRERMIDALAKLPPLAIGRQGQLQEWLEDHEEAQPDHRHLSHLYGLYPGNEITPDLTPELAAAVCKTLDNRQNASELEDVEFTLALFAAGRARLRDGDEARKQLAYLIGELCFDNLMTFSKPGIAGAETYIFVADGNFGGSAAIGEMLLQSHAGEIHLLPAMPASWHTGRYSGLRARGNVEVSVEWKDGRLIETSVYAMSPIRTHLRYADKTIPLVMAAGDRLTFDGELEVKHIH